MSIPNFNANIPQPTDLISDSQNDLLNNNKSLDGIFGIDHYPFSNTTQNKGFHNTVTTPIILPVPPSMTSAHPTTTVNPIFYAMQDLADVGVIQYSKPPTIAPATDEVATPLTHTQSPAAGISMPAGIGQTIDLIDFSSITSAMGTIFAFGQLLAGPNVNDYRNACFIFYWNKAPNPLLTLIQISSFGLTVVEDGSGKLALRNLNASAQTVRYSISYYQLIQ